MASRSDSPKTVLVLDDEHLVRSLVRHILELDGYVVLEAGNGQDALHILDRNSGSIDLLITDVLMPGLSGVDVVTQVRRRYPSVKVVFMSGFKGETPLEEALQGRHELFLQKPFSRLALLKAVRAEIGPPID